MLNKFSKAASHPAVQQILAIIYARQAEDVELGLTDSLAIYFPESTSEAHIRTAVRFLACGISPSIKFINSKAILIESSPLEGNPYEF